MYRAKTEAGSYVYGYLVSLGEEQRIYTGRKVDGEAEWIPVLPDTIQCSTNCTDKNGGLIFEGDLIEIGEYGCPRTGKVVYSSVNGHYFGWSVYFDKGTPEREWLRSLAHCCKIKTTKGV